MLARVRDLWRYLAPWRRRYGVLAGSRLGLQVRRLAYAAPAGTIVPLRVPGLRHAAYGRARTSDAFVFRQHFLEHELGPGLPATADAIIDAGANVGYAALYLAWRYPEARILCVEVDAGNLAMLGRNVAAYPNIAVVSGGLWSHAARLAITNPEGSAFAFVVVERPDGPIAAFGVDDLQRSQRMPRIDLLKLDIEGAEIEVLSSAERWIGDVGTILVEEHESLRPGCEAMVASTAATHGFTTSRSGEYTVLRRTTSPITPPTGSP
jgi:FkbM family methyltransferase